MAKIDLPYLKSYKVAGRTYYYFNRRGFPAAKLPGDPLSPAWLAAYNAAKDASNKGTSQPVRGKVVEGSFADLIARYYASPKFLNLSKLTQQGYRNEIEKLRKAHGHESVVDLDWETVEALMAKKADTPGAANKLLRTVRMLMKYAVKCKMRDFDPTAGVDKLKVPGDGFIAWTDDDIAKFEAAFPIGSKPRLAMALALYTGQRRSDVILMSRKHIVRNGTAIELVQEKTGTSLEVPIHPDLAEILSHVTHDIPAFIVTDKGKAYSRAGFGNWFGDMCRRAGLPKGYNAHGLRKAAARRLAEAGCTANEIMSITGHKDISEVERYTRSAAQIKMAASGMAKLGSAKR
ncbi:tyrosine-type recombinase/integrase [Devosia sp. ZW T5_3]|uniref:tyrosine-type recombinase/integrase n=1 Tax=Devosia sp. ZW T5_3 TaxID=3378085 RepID=UPI003854FB8C